MLHGNSSLTSLETELLTDLNLVRELDNLIVVKAYKDDNVVNVVKDAFDEIKKHALAASVTLGGAVLATGIIAGFFAVIFAVIPSLLAALPYVIAGLTLVAAVAAAGAVLGASVALVKAGYVHYIAGTNFNFAPRK